MVLRGTAGSSSDTRTVGEEVTVLELNADVDVVAVSSRLEEELSSRPDEEPASSRASCSSEAPVSLK